MDMAGGDFRLRDESPCIDAGTNLVGLATVVNTYGDVFHDIRSPTCDILGNTRFMDGNGDGTIAWDIGVYEFDPTVLRFAPNVEVTGDGLIFTVKGQPGQMVSIERSDDLLEWEPLTTVTILPSGQTPVDPIAGNEPHVFFRAVSVP